MSFVQVLERHPWEAMSARIAAATRADAERALARAERGDCGFDDFIALISPAAAHLLEPMAQLSHARTVRRFGRTMQLYSPLYLSNECQNICTYCGFSVTNKIPRRTLTPGEILREAGVLRKTWLRPRAHRYRRGAAPCRHPVFCDALDLLGRTSRNSRWRCSRSTPTSTRRCAGTA